METERKRLGFTLEVSLSEELKQEQRSDLLGIPLISLSQWETGRRNPPIYVQKMLIAVLECPAILKKNLSKIIKKDPAYGRASFC